MSGSRWLALTKREPEFLAVAGLLMCLPPKISRRVAALKQQEGYYAYL